MDIYEPEDISHGAVDMSAMEERHMDVPRTMLQGEIVGYTWNWVVRGGMFCFCFTLCCVVERLMLEMEFVWWRYITKCWICDGQLWEIDKFMTYETSLLKPPLLMSFLILCARNEILN